MSYNYKSNDELLALAKLYYSVQRLLPVDLQVEMINRGFIIDDIEKKYPN